MMPFFEFDDEPAIGDIVNHPPHYKTGGIDTYDFIAAKGLGYEAGNIVKYIARHEHKGMPLQDLKKAEWYLKKLIARVEADERGNGGAQKKAVGR